MPFQTLQHYSTYSIERDYIGHKTQRARSSNQSHMILLQPKRKNIFILGTPHYAEEE